MPLERVLVARVPRHPRLAREGQGINVRGGREGGKEGGR